METKKQSLTFTLAVENELNSMQILNITGSINHRLFQNKTTTQVQKKYRRQKRRMILRLE